MKRLMTYRSLGESTKGERPKTPLREWNLTFSVNAIAVTQNVVRLYLKLVDVAHTKQSQT